MKNVTDVMDRYKDVITRLEDEGKVRPGVSCTMCLVDALYLTVQVTPFSP